MEGEQDSSYIDIYTVYGVSFLKGSYFTMLNRASSKGYVSNDSRLENGVRMVAKPQYAKYASRTFSVQIIMQAASEPALVDKYEAFTDKISGGLFLLKLPSKKRVLKLVYSNIKPGLEYKGGFATFTLDLIEPNPKDRIKLQ